MLKGSITLRLLSSFALAFFIMSLILLHLTNDFLREATDRSQSAVYAQKVDAILGALERRARQAYFPAMAVVDQERFKMSVVKTLRELHYTYSFQVIYPVIMDRGGGVVMHPKYLYGDRSLADREYIRKGLKLKEGQFHFVSDNGEENWFFFKYFEAWDWVVGYVAPLDAKYADVKQFLGALVIAVLVLTPLILLALWFIINKTTRPLIRLTRFSSRMAEGDLDQRIEIPGGGEIGELARAFAHMRDSMRRKVSELERENAENKKTMVTLRKNEEKLLTLNQELEYERFQLLTIFDSITAMIDVIDIDSYTVLFMNKHGRELYGEDAVGRQCHEVFYDLESICDSCTNEMMLKQKGEPYHFEYHNRKLDRYFLSTNRIIKWSDGRDVKFTISLDITDRKKTEEELRNSEESSRQILASSPIGVGIARIKDGMIMFTNTRNAEHLGCAVGELVGKSIEDLWVEPERQEEFMEIFQKEGRVQSREVQLRRPDKSSFWSLLTWEQMRYHGERSILFWIYDIDGIKQAERRIDGLNRMKEDLLSTDRLPDKLKRITDGVVEIFDADFARVWIIGQGDLCDAGCFHAMVTEGPHVCRHRDRCLRLIASSGRYTHVDGELHRRIPFGSYKIGRIASDKGPRLLTNDAVHDPRIHDHDWAARLDLVSFAGYRILSASGDPIGVLGLFSKHPISEQDDAHLEDLANTTSHVIQSSRAEEELRKARNYIRNIFDSMPSALVGVDPNGVVNQWNREAENMMVTKGEDANGRPLTEVFPGLTGQMEKIHKAISRREPRVDARIPRHADGATRYEDVTVYPLIANGVEGAVIRVDDVTERVRIEEMMIQTEKMLSVGGLAAGMAHEIKNPLGGILQNTQVLSNRILRDLPKNLRVAKECGITMDALKMYINKRGIDEMVNMILDSGKRAIQIIENMLSFSRKSASKPVLHNLTALLNQTVEIAKSDYDLKKKYDFRDIEIIKEYDEATPEVQCEASKIQQVYFNILKNGAEAMIEAGVDKPRFILRAAPDADGARIEIEDNGPGMNDETRSNIFEPFFTTKGLGEGTGLGLSVSYFIITENHGGAMTIDSTPGKGARFIIRLPREMEE